MSNGPSFLPEVEEQWTSYLNSLRTSNAAAQAQVDLVQGQRRANEVSESQLDQAYLDQLAAAQEYNSFIEHGSYYIKEALDAETRLKRPNLTAMERIQLETKRETMYALSAEFIQFKMENQASLLHLRPVDAEGKTYYIDGRVEWNDSLEGLAGQAWDGLKDLASGTKEALIRGPFTPEENHAICQSALGGLLPALAGMALPAPGAQPGSFLWNEALGQSLNAADPAGEACRIVYPKGTSPRDMWLRGEATEGGSFMADEATAELFVPLEALEASFQQAFADPEMQARWDAAARALNALMGSEAMPYLGTPESLFAQGDGQGAIDPSDDAEDAQDADWDVAEFAPGIDSDQLWFRQTGLDFETNAIDGAESFRSDAWFDEGAPRTDMPVDGGGQPMFSDQVDALAQAMADFAPPAAGQNGLAPTPYASVLTPVLASNWT